ncbi:MAG: histone deacetylase [Candidatus Thermoplasmatota archaeon]|nr:histone deacetylase [Candidatus Thermoplasmatota archaeon]
MDDQGMTIPVYYHQDYLKPTQTSGHPESPERIRAILRAIEREGIPADMVPPPRFTEQDLNAVHTGEHIKRVRDFGVGYMDPDTFHLDHTFDQSIKAAGGVLGAGKQAYLEKRPTFALPRPPGHHAGSDYNMGFCYFNNVALAARIMQRTIDDLEKIAIIDIDAHHGNGTSDIFEKDPSVLYVSTHNWGIFPGTGSVNDVGSGEGEGKTVNIPMEWGAGDPTFESSTSEIIMPILRSFDPDMIFISLGVDAHMMDPLTGLTLSTPGYLSTVESIYEYARSKKSSRISVELEGGYHLLALSEVVVGAMDIMAPDPKGVQIRYAGSKESAPDKNVILKAREVQSSYWRDL